MTGLEFLSATIGQLVWPIFIVVLVLILKEPIKKLASNPRLTKVKAGPGGLELELNQELDEAERELQQADSSTKELEAPKVDEDAALDFISEMRRLADVAPRAVVLESHVRLERLLRDSIDAPASDPRKQRILSVRTLARQAAQQGILTDNEAEVIGELSYMRNRVAHEPDEVISKEAALRYAEVTAELAIAIRLARGETVLDGPML